MRSHGSFRTGERGPVYLQNECKAQGCWSWGVSEGSLKALRLFPPSVVCVLACERARKAADSP